MKALAADDSSGDEPGEPPRESPQVVLVLVPHVLERVRLPGIHRLDALLQTANRSQPIGRHTTGAAISTNSLTYTTLGINLLSSGESIRLLVDGIYTSEPAVFTGTELEVQLIAIF